MVVRHREEACELKKYTWYCGLAQWVTILMGMVKPFSVPGIALGLLMPFREMWYKYLVNVKPSSGTAFP